MAEGAPKLAECKGRLGRALLGMEASDVLASPSEVEEAFARFLGALTESAPRQQRRDARFDRDDGLALAKVNKLSPSEFELMGSVWWIDQTTDPFWGQFLIDTDARTVAEYSVRVGFLRPGDPDFEQLASPPRYLKKAMEEPSPETIHIAWNLGLSPDDVPWFFQFDE